MDDVSSEFSVVCPESFTSELPPSYQGNGKTSPCATPPKRPRHYEKTGYHAAKKALKRFGLSALHRRSTVARELAAWRSGIEADMGGNLSTQELAILDLACQTRLLLNGIDGWLLQQPSLVNKRNRSLLTALVQRTAIANALASYLEKLGLRRRAREVPSLQSYIETRYAAGGAKGSGAPGQDHAGDVAPGATNGAGPDAEAEPEAGVQGAEPGGASIAAPGEPTDGSLEPVAIAPPPVAESGGSEVLEPEPEVEAPSPVKDLEERTVDGVRLVGFTFSSLRFEDAPVTLRPDGKHELGRARRVRPLEGRRDVPSIGSGQWATLGLEVLRLLGLAEEDGSP